MINLTEQLKIAMLKQKISQSDLADRTQQSRANLANKLSRNDFKLSEYDKLVTALGCQLEINIILPNGEKI
ncbi:MAG: helix-turn-helix domain-containing protein [Clostridia bacterium]|nr:helix-turn-helix domain-containing protein [Clostridia bacterium]